MLDDANASLHSAADIECLGVVAKRRNRNHFGKAKLMVGGRGADAYAWRGEISGSRLALSGHVSLGFTDCCPPNCQQRPQNEDHLLQWTSRPTAGPLSLTRRALEREGRSVAAGRRLAVCCLFSMCGCRGTTIVIVVLRAEARGGLEVQVRLAFLGG